jgi:hypothetical protein
LISAGWLAATSPERKREQLQARLSETRAGLQDLARRWIVSTDGNDERRRRESCAAVVLDWLTSDRELIYHRVAAVRRALCLPIVKQHQLADFADTVTDLGRERPNSPAHRFTQTLRQCFDEWADRTVPESWNQILQAQRDVGPWLPTDDVARLAHYLRDYFCSSDVFADVVRRLWSVVSLKMRDESALHESRRSYVRLLLDDLMLTPGLDGERSPAVMKDGSERDDDFGLMAPFVRRWQRRLPAVLAAGFGGEVTPPPGNRELLTVLELHP